MDAISIYSASASDELQRNFKSHAPNYRYLKDETRRLLNVSNISEAPIIWLRRDPRDAMISYYHFTVERLGIDIPQDVFAGKFDYFLAAPIDRGSQRKVCLETMTVLRAYLTHYRAWSRYCEAQKGLEVRFETLLAAPEATFARVAEYLGSKAPLNAEALPELVSQRSSEKRSRGIAGGWKAVYPEYRDIIDRVEKVFEDDPKFLA